VSTVKFDSAKESKWEASMKEKLRVMLQERPIASSSATVLVCVNRSALELGGAGLAQVMHFATARPQELNQRQRRFIRDQGLDVVGGKHRLHRRSGHRRHVGHVADEVVHNVHRSIHLPPEP
jgi:hypothetical protein